MIHFNEKLNACKVMCIFHVMTEVVLIVCLLLSLLSRELFTAILMCCLIQLTALIFTEFTYPVYSKELIRFKYNNPNKYFKYNVVYYNIDRVSRIMNVSCIISIIGTLLWFIEFLIYNSILAYKVEYLAFVIIIVISAQHNADIFNTIFSNDNFWTNPKITPLKQIKEMIEDINV